MSKDFFKAAVSQIMSSGTKPILSSFMCGPGHCGIAHSWMWKLYTMIEKEQVSERDLDGVAKLIIFRREQGTLTYFPTDIELRRIIRDYREIKEMKAKKKAAEATGVHPPSSSHMTTPPLPSHKQRIICVDCGEVHVADEMCPKVY